MIRMRIFVSAAALAVTACMPKPQPAPEPPPAAELAPAPAPTPTPTPAGDWRDIALTPGVWRYDAARRQADFGPAGEALFSMRCDAASRQMVLTRAGTSSGNTLRIRTSYGFRAVPLEVQAGSTQLVARLPATDRVLDGMAFSRGRFLIEMTGAPTLVIPAWTEPSRVIEDCRV